ncbi:MAG: bifunctional pyr operon transcriptional regulator/uracil phosphoribosyltransferase PyrR [Gemmatimonadetes bacterium]|nr:MAG: bifunctional pyr operon transcriptional regulator/uracil phosphoribosyltransferase PyrR [Gemmatimonadota bacterium]
MPDPQRRTVMDEAAVRRALARMSREIVELNEGTASLVLMGVRRRGVELAEFVRDEIERAEGVRVPQGTIDITLYRDDLLTVGPRPVVGETELPPEGVDERAVVLVDDVLFTGRTVRAALNELMDYGRPSRIYLCVLVDRGGRELPIAPDVVGREITVQADETVEVRVPRLDGSLGVDLVSVPTEAQ